MAHLDQFQFLMKTMSFTLAKYPEIMVLAIDYPLLSELMRFVEHYIVHCEIRIG